MGLDFGDIMSSVMSGVSSGLGMYGSQKQKELDANNPALLTAQKRAEQMKILSSIMSGMSGKHGPEFSRRISGVDFSGDPDEILKAILQMSSRSNHQKPMQGRRSMMTADDEV